MAAARALAVLASPACLAAKIALSSAADAAAAACAPPKHLKRFRHRGRSGVSCSSMGHVQLRSSLWSLKP